MTLEEYREQMWQYAAYPDKGNNIQYAEQGFVTKIRNLSTELKQVIDDDNKTITPKRREKIIDDLGDLIWYFSAMTYELPYIYDQQFASKEVIKHRRIKKVKSDFNKINNIMALIEECESAFHERKWVMVVEIVIAIGEYLNVSLSEILQLNIKKKQYKNR